MRYFSLPVLAIAIISTSCNESSRRELSEAERLVQAQLEAYNLRDIDAFLEPFSKDVELYNFPDSLIKKGKAEIRPIYQSMFENLTELNCQIKNRTVLGNTVIDHEYVTGMSDKPIEAIAIYQIEDGKIRRVYFVD